MATTRIIPMHINKGKSIAQCLKARIDYAKNPDKTQEGLYVSSFACNPETADSEFLLARNAYVLNTGRLIPNEIIAYQFRQSFKPGEVTPEEANKIGYDLALKFFEGQHAFIVATHVDKAHVHNHIIICSTALDCEHKFHNFYHSSAALADMSDKLCREHHLSVIEKKNHADVSYDKWQGKNVKPNER